MGPPRRGNIAAGGALEGGGGAAGEPLPLGAKHRDEARFEVGRIAPLHGLHGLGHLVAAGPLGAAEDGIEQTATRVGVDLDQLRPIGPQVKVVAEKNPCSLCRPPGGFGRPGQNRVLPGRQRDNLFDGRHHLGHALDVAGRHKGHRIGEKVRPRLGQHGLQRAVPRVTGERADKRLAVERDALAAGIERLGSARAVAAYQRGKKCFGKLG